MRSRFHQLLNEYAKDWNERVRAGEVSSMGGIEFLQLVSFCDWLEEREQQMIEKLLGLTTKNVYLSKDEARRLFDLDK